MNKSVFQITSNVCDLVFETQQVLKFRHESQHAKCADCSRFKELCRQARTGPEKDSIVAAYKNHISDMLEDREIDIRMMELSEQSCSGVLCVFFV